MRPLPPSSCLTGTIILFLFQNKKQKAFFRFSGKLYENSYSISAAVVRFAEGTWLAKVRRTAVRQAPSPLGQNIVFREAEQRFLLLFPEKEEINLANVAFLPRPRPLGTSSLSHEQRTVFREAEQRFLLLGNY
jgi:hypothetical protein